MTILDTNPASTPAGESPLAVVAEPVIPLTIRRLRWWHEVIFVAVFYAIYTFIRGQFGSAAVAPETAFANAQRVIGLEEHLGIYNELAIQQWFLGWPALIRAVNIFYGLFHFAIPVAVLVVLYRRSPGRYRLWRNTLMAGTGLALIGFSLFPLMPPRLLCACPLGSGTESGFVDTLAQFGGLWSFGSHGVGAVSNQYAAMPSLHFAWALWCGLAIASIMRARWARAFALSYPAVTLLVIIVTANHFWLDALGGALVLGIGGVVALGLNRARHRSSKSELEVCGDLVQ